MIIGQCCKRDEAKPWRAYGIMNIRDTRMLLKQFLFNAAKAVAPERLKRFNAFVENGRRDRCYYCPVCKAGLSYFNPAPVWYLKKLDKYGYVHSLFASETFNLFDYECPSCSAPGKPPDFVIRLLVFGLCEFKSQANEQYRSLYCECQKTMQVYT